VSWLNRFSNLFRRDKMGAELEEELRFHLDARIRDNLNAGMNAEATPQGGSVTRPSRRKGLTR
jgi:hypothetical protein